MTARKEAIGGSPELTDKVSLLDSVASAQGDGLVTVDVQRRCVFWSRRMAEISGVAALEVLDQPPIEPLPLLGPLADDAALSRALEGRIAETPNGSYVVRETGRRGSFDARYFPVIAASGAVIGAAVFVRDTTESQVADQKIQETELRFKNMADASPVLLWMSNADGLCTFFNQTWLDFTGRTLQQEWGIGWAEGVHFEDFQRCIDTYVAAFNARRVFEMEYRLRRADGEYRWLLDRGSPRYTPGGEFAGYIGSCADITDRKDIEEELRRAVRDRDEFLSIAAHELRTPLTSLQLQLESFACTVGKAATDAAVATRTEKSARGAVRQTHRLARLIDDLLDVSRLTVGKIELRLEATDLRRVVLDVVERFSELASSTGTPIHVSAEEEIIGRFDPTRVHQIVNNLLSNALKYAPGHPIEVAVSRLGGKAHLAVKDRGSGILAADRDRIFERFERAVSSRNYGGFGLGLWITRQLVEAHGGRIWVDGDAGAGATFRVEFDATLTG